jgi:hypothetical protein
MQRKNRAHRKPGDGRTNTPGPEGASAPQQLPNYQKRVPRFNGRVISRYSLGMTDRSIQEPIKKSCREELPAEPAGRVTDAGKSIVKSVYTALGEIWA